MCMSHVKQIVLVKWKVLPIDGFQSCDRFSALFSTSNGNALARSNYMFIKKLIFGLISYVHSWTTLYYFDKARRSNTLKVDQRVFAYCKVWYLNPHQKRLEKLQWLVCLQHIFTKNYGYHVIDHWIVNILMLTLGSKVSSNSSVLFSFALISLPCKQNKRKVMDWTYLSKHIAQHVFKNKYRAILTDCKGKSEKSKQAFQTLYIYICAYLCINMPNN